MLRFGSDEAEHRMMDNFRRLQALNPPTLLVPRVIFRSWNAASSLVASSLLPFLTVALLTRLF